MEVIKKPQSDFWGIQSIKLGRKKNKHIEEEVACRGGVHDSK